MVQTQGMTMTSPTVLRRIAAAELVRHREAAGIDQVDVDQACELSRGSTSRYETCYSSMSAPVARRIFSHLGVEGAELSDVPLVARGCAQARRFRGCQPVRVRLWRRAMPAIASAEPSPR
ncbi:helix-turn-helix domain-containing protein, partial [Glycomyces tritici]